MKNKNNENEKSRFLQYDIQKAQSQKSFYSLKSSRRG